MSLVAACTADHGAEDLGELTSIAPAELRVLGPGSVDTDGRHTCAIFEGGFVKCWGDNAYGQLGLGDTLDRGVSAATTYDDLPFVNLGTGRTAKAIATGSDHTCALLDDDTVKCWGYNSSGQLGLELESYLNIGDQPYEMGDNLPTVDLGTNGLGAPHTAKAIFAGHNATCALLEDDALKCWGSNNYGKLGLGRGLPYWTTVGSRSSEMGDDLPAVDLGTGLFATRVAIANDHMCALLNTGEVKCWGDNEDGNLGLMSGDPGSPAHTTDRGDAPGEMGDDLPVVYLGLDRTAKAITAGYNHTCVILDTDEVKCWGGNEAGELGLGDTNERGNDANEMSTLATVDLGLSLTGDHTAKAIAAGGNHTCVVLDDDRIKCWGSNSSGELGYEDWNQRGHTAASMGDGLPYVDVGTDIDSEDPLIPLSIVAGGDHTCVIDSGKRWIKCWGSDHDGRLGVGIPTDDGRRGDDSGEMGNALPYTPAGSQTAQGLSVGRNHACAHLTTGGVKCWGYNASGQLGLEDNVSRGDQPYEMGVYLSNTLIGDVTSVMAGSHFSCALKLLPSSSQTGITCWGANYVGSLGTGNAATLGDNAGEMASLDFIHLGAERTVTSASVGNGHACAVLDDGSVKCWGFNGSGQLGLGDKDNRGDGSGEMGDALDAIDLGPDRTAKAVSAGGGHTCALLDDDTVKCWGENNHGQLGLGDESDRGDALGEMGASLPTVPLGDGRTAKAISAGYDHTCALLDNNAVKCWGKNGYGQLGLGHTNDMGDGPNDMSMLPTVHLGPGRTAKAVSAGEDHTCALLDDDTIKCWGRNDRGQLGLHDTSPRGIGTGQMGSLLPRVDLGFGRTARAVVTSVTSPVTCALLDTNQIKCWGENLSGGLGSPGCGGATPHCGDDHFEMGDSLKVVDLGFED
ncbi:hypothetical protein WMF31_30205 [Sorangium sp. So ce1036]|uniref:RCC1 domain-containing protein n=1 Tax=Sorangium sp. So ce1036 TaxID=3133328 RepID=UPI003F09B894